MRLLLYSLLLSLLSTLAGYAQSLRFDSISTPSWKVYALAEVSPSFPGGNDKIESYINREMRYPKSARSANIEGRVFVTFVVNNKGYLVRIFVLNTKSKDIDNEAIRLVKNMPKWSPGKVGDRSVNCRFTVPVNFSLYNVR